MGHFLTASRRVFPALKVGTVEAAMVMDSPVCGLRPCRPRRPERAYMDILKDIT